MISTNERSPLCQPTQSPYSEKSATASCEIFRRHKQTDSNHRYYNDRELGFSSLLCIGTTIFTTLPGTMLCIVEILHITGQLWPATVLCLYQLFVIWAARSIMATDENSRTIQTIVSKRNAIIATTSMLDMLLIMYLLLPTIHGFVRGLFTDVDGTTIVDWTWHKRTFRLVGTIFAVAFLLRLQSIVMLFLSFCQQYGGKQLALTTKKLSNFFVLRWHRLCTQPVLSHCSASNLLDKLLRFYLFMAVLCTLACLTSTFGTFFIYQNNESHYANCDPLDETECALPFPSFHHMVRDATTQTGWRVRLRPETLPMLRNGRRLSLDFLNEQLDGFSTMAPLLFYVNGLKEAHENNHATRSPGLPGTSKLAESTTSRSWTLLLNMNTSKLVAHSAEIDYTDAERPLAMIMPSKPLNHGSHYAVVLYNATDMNGRRLQQTNGMRQLFDQRIDMSTEPEGQRLQRYKDEILPALGNAAPWVDHHKDLSAIQIIFDFVTASRDAQLGPISLIQDATLEHIKKSWQGNWTSRARMVRQQNHACDIPKYHIKRSGVAQKPLVARTIHAELDVPWFLKDFGPNHRASTLNMAAIESKTPASIGRIKFLIHVPCSVRDTFLAQNNSASAANSGDKPMPLQAIVDYGHGLFYNREEAASHHLLQVANDERYLIIAADWRGMSSFDIPVLLKMLLSTPELFEATRDNILQGYAAKLSIQLFIRDGLFQTDWLTFRRPFGDLRHDLPANDVAVQPDTAVAVSKLRSVFYGNSQGAILGAGYTSWMRPTRLIDRVILGAPGISLSYIMGHSRDFAPFNKLLLYTFFNNRHIRIILSIQQMAWDPTEGAGWLALYNDAEALTVAKSSDTKAIKISPYPVLLQAGLGDNVVPSVSAESLSRAYGASVLPGNPLVDNLFGIPVLNQTTSLRSANNCNSNTAATTNSKQEYRNLQPNAVLTELLYTNEYSNLPTTNVISDLSYTNNVHLCLRQDCQLIHQMTQFIKTGIITDPCLDRGCVRSTISCYIPWIKNNTRQSNWTCGASF